MTFPILRVLGGALLITTGLAAYSNLAIGASALLLLVVGGAVVVVVALLGHRAQPWDITIFFVGILALGVVAGGYSAAPQIVTYSATRHQLPFSSISVIISAGTGSVSVGFTSRPNIGYEVNFTRQAWFYSFGGVGTDTVTNSTSSGRFELNIGSSWSAVSVLLGRGYHVDVSASSGAGSIDLTAMRNEAIGNVSLHASAGSIDAVVDSSVLTNLVLRADLGSVNLVSHRLGAAGANVPVTLSASTGSISLDASIVSRDAAAITATTSLGSITQNLTGFTVTQNTRNSLVATAGDLASASYSLNIQATASVGSVDLTARFV